MSNLVIVAIPDENDRVWKVSSEQVPHLTVLYLGDVDEVANLETIVEFVQHAASTTLGRFYLPVDKRGELGDDPELGPADVLFFKKGRYDYKAIRDFRAALLQEHNIRTAYDSAQQHDGPWMPHLTLGYEKQPAKPQTGDQDYPFYDVSFNKIAVWTDDYDGPEFDLKDPWDEFDALETVPMDVAMSDISHHGVKGMHWGERKADIGKAATTSLTKVGQAVADVHKFAGDVKFESHTRPQVDPTTGEESHSKAREQVVEAAHKDFKSKDLAAINAKPEYVKARKLRNRLLKPLDKTTKAYRSEVKAAYIQRLETTANSMKNPSGTREYSIRERGGDLPTSKYQWEVSTREARHAAGDDFTLIDVITDADGFITGTKTAKSESSMAQTAELGMDFLAHYGIKGMHWGVRNDKGGDNTSGRGEKKREGIQRFIDPQGHNLGNDIIKGAIWPLVPPLGLFSSPAQIRLARGAARGAQAKVHAVQDEKFKKRAHSAKSFVAIHNGAQEQINRSIESLNKKYPDLSKPATKKKYDDEVLKAMQDGYKTSANSLTNKRNTLHLDVEFHNDGQDFKIHAKEGPGTPLPPRVKHALEAEGEDDVTFAGKILRDDQGYIVGFDFDDFPRNSAAHSTELGAALVSSLFSGDELEHYGIKGMHWGVRREGAVTTQTHLDTGLRRRRTKVVAQGGESHDAHPDAVKAAVAKQKIKKSGPAALSTQELRDLANRLQVENQVGILMSSKGKRFVNQQLENEGKNALKRGAKSGARAAGPHVFKRVAKPAATLATTAALAL